MKSSLRGGVVGWMLVVALASAAQADESAGEPNGMPAAVCGLDPSCTTPLPSVCEEPGSCLADCGCCCGCDSWTVLAGGGLYSRENGARTVFVDGGGAPVFSPGVGFQSGFVGSLIRHRSDGYDYDIGLMWIMSGNTLGFGLLPAGSNIPASPIVFTDDTLAASVYSTGLFSFEWNRRFGANDDFQFLAGFRYIGLNERLLLGAVNTVPEVFAGLSQTSNSLYGLQIGGDAKLWQNGAWEVNGVVKAGVYYNDATVDLFALGLPGPIIAAGTATNGGIAFQGQAEIAATWWLRENLGLRLGYQAMWLEGMTLATNQFAAPNFDGAIFMHGGVIQAEVTW